jgi:hypothetical protein
MALRKWERQELFAKTMRRLHQQRVTSFDHWIRTVRRATLNRPRSTRTDEELARIARRIMAPH